VELSRDIFREYDIRGIAGKDLTPDVARLIGRAFAAFLAERNVTGTLAVGRDNRPSGEGLHAALLEGLLMSGVSVVDIGIVPTPVAYWAQHNLDVAGSIQLTGTDDILGFYDGDITIPFGGVALAVRGAEEPGPFSCQSAKNRAANLKASSA